MDYARRFRRGVRKCVWETIIIEDTHVVDEGVDVTLHDCSAVVVLDVAVVPALVHLEGFGEAPIFVFLSEINGGLGHLAN